MKTPEQMKDTCEFIVYIHLHAAIIIIEDKDAKHTLER